jgi:hypothetical protein
MTFEANTMPEDNFGLEPSDGSQTVEFYEDPVYTESNRYLEKKADLVRNVLSVEDADSLKLFIESKFESRSHSESSTISQVYELPYRPDEWDSNGVIQKVHDIAKAHILKTYAVVGQLEPRSFKLLMTNIDQSYGEEYGAYNQDNEILYTSIVTVSNPDDYWRGETKYPVNGEGLRLNRVDMLVHRNESLNTWEVSGVEHGTRFDLLVVFQESDRRVSYDYEIDQTDEGAISF